MCGWARLIKLIIFCWKMDSLGVLLRSVVLIYPQNAKKTDIYSILTYMQTYRVIKKWHPKLQTSISSKLLSRMTNSTYHWKDLSILDEITLNVNKCYIKYCSVATIIKKIVPLSSVK